jgi:hypothetical protein
LFLYNNNKWEKIAVLENPKNSKKKKRRSERERAGEQNYV